MTNDPARLTARLVLFCIALLLFFTFRLYRFGYFYVDDFNNLALAQYANGWLLLKDNLHPSTSTYRPFGTTVYWACLHLFGLNPLPYHLLAWTIHTVNVFLVYRILKFALKSTYAAAFGAMLFAFLGSCSEIFFNFGTIFELVAALWFFLAFWIYLHHSDSWAGFALMPLIYFVANNTKEMAITMPAVWLLYELSVRRSIRPFSHSNPPQSESTVLFVAKRFALPAAIGLWFLSFKIPQTGQTSPSDPYHMDFSWVTLGRGFGWYLNVLYDTHLRWGGWMILSALIVTLLLLRGNRWAVFFLVYIFLTLLPVVFLVNHRYDFYWYIPALGLAGLAAASVRALKDWILPKLPSRAAIAIGLAAFALACYWHYFEQKKLSAPRREDVRALSREYESFIAGLKSVKPPGWNETVYFLSVPRHFDQIATTAATQVVFRRTDIKARIVDAFPPEARYRLRFENSKVLLDSP